MDEPLCNNLTKLCEAKSGSILLEKIVVRSKLCINCTSEGLDLKLTGSTFLWKPTKCSTHHLHHDGRVNYAGSGNTTLFIADQDAENHVRLGWNTCWKVHGIILML